MLAGKHIVLGVTGGIAAYKAVEVCRRLVDAGAHVTPIMTEGARHFVGETTLSTLASETVRTSLWEIDHGADGSPITHTRLGQTADLVIVAPATARVISDLRTGRSADLLSATLIATTAPVLLAPAMHTEMWEHPAVRENLEVLATRGVHVVPPEEGRLAGGDSGAGRLADPATIVEAAEKVLAGSGADADLAGLAVLVTAGGTREPIDPVRFIGNRSSGKQGHAIAEEAAARGARVTLVTTVDRPASAGVEIVRVDTADEMHAAVAERASSSDVVVMAAAVADFKPAAPADRKIKKAGGTPEVVLEPTVDILASLGASKPAGQTLVGFAAETDDLRANAQAKLAAKGADLIVANDVSAPGAGFEHDTNEVVLLSAGGATEVPQADKRQIARAVLDAVITLRSPNPGSQT
ncbi:MAG TPA: bifunctional phosphopantothenoylcysteine decarboxylase/phosphopantothenate--cysteine ligase CoaBC [Acidimicrobiales bacterium]|nr:bifunctional phosphopantothenoylcysteine decarboxylase/phosphopantothenate--cysteine ligase CoaBC [Acidimicrobiales bacterium]